MQKYISIPFKKIKSIETDEKENQFFEMLCYLSYAEYRCSCVSVKKSNKKRQFQQNVCMNCKIAVPVCQRSLKGEKSHHKFNWKLKPFHRIFHIWKICIWKTISTDSRWSPLCNSHTQRKKATSIIGKPNNSSQRRKFDNCKKIQQGDVNNTFTINW